jgi:hypothetical protein
MIHCLFPWLSLVIMYHEARDAQSGHRQREDTQDIHYMKTTMCPTKKKLYHKKKRNFTIY